MRGPMCQGSFMASLVPRSSLWSDRFVDSGGRPKIRPIAYLAQTGARNGWAVGISEAYLSRESKNLDPFVTELGSEPWRTGDAERAAQEALHKLGRAGADLRLVRLGENALFHAPT